MKKLFLLILFLLPEIISSQIIRENGYVKIPEELWNAFRDSCVNCKYDLETIDSMFTTYEKFSKEKEKNYNKIIQNKDTLLNNYRQALIDCKSKIGIVMKADNQSKRFFEWNGFYVGYKASYYFSDSVILSSSFLANIQSNIYADCFIKAGDFIINPSLTIPLIRKPAYISVKVGYLLF